MSTEATNEAVADAAVNGQAVAEQPVEEQQSAAAPADTSATDTTSNFADQAAQVQYPTFNMDEPTPATTAITTEESQQDHNLEAAALGVEVAGEQVEQQQQQEEHVAPFAQEEQQHQQQQEEEQEPLELICRICGKGITSDDSSDPSGFKRRLMVRFPPVPIPFADSAVTTWDQDVQLHVFCGKTASILPTVNQPDLEILSKAGVKNKHGIGPEVNAAIARTRCAILAGHETSSSREKEFYLIKEFEAHLQAIRAAHESAVAAMSEEAHAAYHHLPPAPAHQYYHHHAAASAPHQEKQVPHKAGQSYTKPRAKTTTTSTPASATTTTTTTTSHHEDQHVDWALHHAVAAATGDADLLSQQQEAAQQFQEEVLADGKIRCGCGGSHYPTGTPKGAASWRSHVMTKQHQKWMEENGMLGAV